MRYNYLHSRSSCYKKCCENVNKYLRFGNFEIVYRWTLPVSFLSNQYVRKMSGNVRKMFYAVVSQLQKKNKRLILNAIRKITFDGKKEFAQTFLIIYLI